MQETFEVAQTQNTEVLIDACVQIWSELARMQTTIDELEACDRAAARRISDCICAQVGVLFEWLCEAPIELPRN
jgi:hypothetical protein